MVVSAIVAMDMNYLIGIGKNIPWHLPKDFKYFKDTTMGHPIIMGRKSFESLNCKPLKGREHVIVSTDPLLNYSGVSTVTTVEDAISLAKTMSGADEIFICGGGQIYDYCFKNNLIERLYVTVVDTHIHLTLDEYNSEEAIYFPKFVDVSTWDMISAKYVLPDEKNEFGMHFLMFEK